MPGAFVLSGRPLSRPKAPAYLSPSMPSIDYRRKRSLRQAGCVDTECVAAGSARQVKYRLCIGIRCASKIVDTFLIRALQF